jgi:phage tail sheath protein FI
MTQTYNSPGVYRQEIFLKAPPALQTGVPGFVGFAGLSPGGEATFNRPVVLYRKEEFNLHFSGVAGSFMADVIDGFFNNGGTRCYAVAADPAKDSVQGLRDAIAVLAPLDDLDLVAVPDAMTLRAFDGAPDNQAIAVVQAELLTHCAQQGNRMAILDSLPGAGIDDVVDQSQRLLLGQREPVNGALYYPWLRSSGNSRTLPPCGHVAGVYARSDAKAGVFKAPANEEIFGVLDLEIQIDNSVQDRLNPARVNCLRAFPGRGIRVWGARTIGSVPPDPNWLYISVRRLFLTLGRWIDLNMAWATFEPNDARLWVRIQRELNVVLTKLLRDGALRGATPAEAFYTKCDAENNPPELRDVGQVVIEIGLAVLAPAEFIVVRIVRRAGVTLDN